MNKTLKTLAVAALMGTVSAPAFAAAHMSATMTCAEYKALTPEEQMTVASMAIEEVHSGATGGSMENDPTATTTPTGTTTEAEADEPATEGSLEQGNVRDGNDPSATADTAAPAEPMDEAAMEKFMTICDQNLDATVSEAAAGLDGTK